MKIVSSPSASRSNAVARADQRLSFRTVTALASKGGTGKTTISAHLAVLAQAYGLETVVLDCDPQRSISDWSVARGLRKPQVVRVDPSRLLEFHAGVMRSGVSLLLIDTPPHGGPSIQDALTLSDLSLVISRPSALDIWAVERAATLARRLDARAEIVINQGPASRGGRETAAMLDAVEQLSAYGLPVAPIGLRTRLIYSEAIRLGRSATELQPHSVAADEIGRLWRHIARTLWGKRSERFEEPAGERRPATPPVVRPPAARLRSPTP